MSFECLVNTISSKLKAITHRLNGKYTFFNEDDLYQEALFDLWDRHKKGVLSDKTNSYILQSCFFFLKNHIRKIYKKIDINSIRISEIINDEDQRNEDMVFSLIEYNNYNCSQENNLLLEDVQRRLSERERNIFSMRLESLTAREIGKKLGISHVMVIKIEKKIRDKCINLKAEIV